MILSRCSILFAFSFTSLTLISPSESSFSFLNAYPQLELKAAPSTVAGEPLMLTPYIKSGQTELARNLSEVSVTEQMGFKSHAGFFTTDEKYNSSQYFWYFPPFSKDEKAPVLLWLQGGPGGSSLFGLFTELGPLVATKEGFALRKHHWALEHHLIFIDNPVGTGFSFTDKEEGYCRNEHCVASSLYNSLQQFFTLFPHLRKNEFFITGESYAGKYIPSLGLEIDMQNLENEEKINLKGMAIGNGYCDPSNQLDYGNYLYQLGLLDDNQLKLFLKYQKQIASDITTGNMVQADLLMDQLMDGDVSGSSYFKTYTRFDNYYNFLKPENDINATIFGHLLHNPKVRRSIHVGGLPFNNGKKVAVNLAFDIMKSVAPQISELLKNYRILFYNGQLDIIVAYPLTENFLRKLEFPASEEYKNASRFIWRVGDDIAGYVKKAGNLYDVLVRNAGHMVPKDQPVWALNLINLFVTGKL